MPLYPGGTTLSNWGLRAEFRFSVELDPESVAAEDFSIVDEYGVAWVANQAELGADLKTLVLYFDDFNDAVGTVEAVYTPGSLVSMAGKTAPELRFAFTPTHLTPAPEGPKPVAIGAFNKSLQGTDTYIVFDLPITREPVSDAYEAFSFTFESRTFAPDGDIIEKTVDAGYACYLLDVPLLPHTWGAVKSGGTWGDWGSSNHYVWGNNGYVPDDYIDFGYGEILKIEIPSGNMQSIQNAIGDVTIIYDGSGKLRGDGGFIPAFEFSYLPENLIQKPHQMETEHVEITDISAVGDLIQIYYHDTKSDDEHIEISNITAVGVLTDIGDL